MIVFSIFATLSNMSTESFDPSKHENDHHNPEHKQNNTVYWDIMKQKIDDIHDQEKKGNEELGDILSHLDKSDPIQTYDTAKQIPIWEENVTDQQVSRMAYLSRQQIATGTEKEIKTWPLRLQRIYNMFS